MRTALSNSGICPPGEKVIGKHRGIIQFVGRRVFDPWNPLPTFDAACGFVITTQGHSLECLAERDPHRVEPEHGIGGHGLFGHGLPLHMPFRPESLHLFHLIVCDRGIGTKYRHPIRFLMVDNSHHTFFGIHHAPSFN